jgi:hypothetical protein
MGVIIVVGESEDEVDASLAGRFLLFGYSIGVWRDGARTERREREGMLTI